MNPVYIDGKPIIVFNGCILHGDKIACGRCEYDGGKLNLISSEGESVDITNFIDQVVKPLTGKYLALYSGYEWYIEIDRSQLAT